MVRDYSLEKTGIYTICEITKNAWKKAMKLNENGSEDFGGGIYGFIRKGKDRSILE